MKEIDHEAVKKCAQECVELANGRVDEMRKSNMAGTVGLSVAYLDLHAQLAAERARVEALCDVIYDANGIAYPFAEMQDKMTAILNAHAQGDEG